MGKEIKKIYLSPPQLNGQEINYIEDALDSNWVAPLGPHVDQFENEIADYVGVSHAVALSSGTAALHLALKIIGVDRGDDIFCSDLTFVATANAIKYLDANPIFIDSDESSWNMCPKSLEMAFESHTPKAVIVTDIYGQSANYNAITKICSTYKVPIIEDAAESLGAEYNGKKCGSFGEMSILSFNGNKIITTSGGGMLLSNNKIYIEKARKLSTQARENALHYEHTKLGYNYRMSNILAAIGRAQLISLDTYVQNRKKIFSYYYNNLKTIENIQLMPEIPNGKSSRWLSTLLLNKKSHKDIEDIIKFYLKQNIEVRPIWKPMHLQPFYKKNQFYHSSKNPLSEYLFEHGLCLPSGSKISKEDMDRIISILIMKIQ